MLEPRVGDLRVFQIERLEVGPSFERRFPQREMTSHFDVRKHLSVRFGLRSCEVISLDPAPFSLPNAAASLRGLSPADSLAKPDFPTLPYFGCLAAIAFRLPIG